MNLRLAYQLPIVTRAGSGPTILMDIFHLGSSRSVVAVDQIHYLALDEQGNQVFPERHLRPSHALRPISECALGLVAPF